MKQLSDVLELEDLKAYNDAYYSYRKLEFENNNDFNYWKHYFFFLWQMLEGVEGAFTVSIDLKKTLLKELNKGEGLYAHIPEFNFLAGYAISIMPSIFGSCEVYEKKSIQLLEKACDLEPGNSIYKMILLGAQWDFGGQEDRFNEVCSKSKQVISKRFSGSGLINKYFRTTLNRYQETLT